MNKFVGFISSTAGRAIRVIAGLALIALGPLTAPDTTTGIILAAIGALPVITGTFDICLLAPIFGAPMSGRKVRAS
jgi:hypothetical protein